MKEINRLIYSGQCVGCGLCEFTCKCNAISMQYDDEGFLIPCINNDKCVECEKCTVKCPLLIKREESNKPLEVFACQCKNEDLLIEATAGGFFPVLAEYVLSRGGVVCGAAYDETLMVRHYLTDKKEEIKKFNGSKYVQSDITRVIPKIIQCLRKNQWVLFSGTPCQVDAILHACTERERRYLITVDVVCYGVPSPGLFKKYIGVIENYFNSRVVDYRFRDKHLHGWSHTTVVKLKNKNEYHEEDYKKIPYFNMFAARNCFRKSCYSCKYNTIKRVSDFTTGNFWGIGTLSDVFNTYQGVSMVLINSNNAKKLFYEIKDDFIIEKRSLEEAIDANDALVEGSTYPKERDKIYKSLANDGFMKMYRKFYRETVWKRIKKKLYLMKKKYIH